MGNVRPMVLFIEDDVGDAELIQNMLPDGDSRLFDVEWVDRLSVGMERLGKGGVDVILLDLSLPDSQGLDTFSKMRAKWSNTPVVVLTGLNDQEIALEAVGRGAQDYLVKGEVEGRSLVRALRYAIERNRASGLLQKGKSGQIRNSG